MAYIDIRDPPMGQVALLVLCKRRGSLVYTLLVAFVLLLGDSFSEGVALRHSQLIPDYLPVDFAHFPHLLLISLPSVVR